MTADEALKIKVGDYVLVDGNQYNVNGVPIKESKLLVVEDGAVKLETPGYRINSTKVEPALIKDFPDDFTKVEDSYFSGELIAEDVIQSFNLQPNESGWHLKANGGFNINTDTSLVAVSNTPVDRIVKRDDGTMFCSGSPDLGVYRPNLSDRKVGKVRVELVDKGFPNALWELARLMTWAQEAKGYQDHDWKNLPDAKNSLPAAASRHRQQHNKGELYDDESNLHHKTSEAFGVLAELELILTGKIEL